MILGIQIIGVLFAFFMMYYSFVHYKRNEFTIKEYSGWVFVWGIFLVIALFPKLLDPLVASLSLARTLDFFIILGFMFLIGVSFYNYTLIRQGQKKFEELVRKIAIRKK